MNGRNLNVFRIHVQVPHIHGVSARVEVDVCSTSTYRTYSADRTCLICRCEAMRSSGFQSINFFHSLSLCLSPYPSPSRTVRSRWNNQSDQIRFQADTIIVEQAKWFHVRHSRILHGNSERQRKCVCLPHFTTMWPWKFRAICHNVSSISTTLSNKTAEALH